MKHLALFAVALMLLSASHAQPKKSQYHVETNPIQLYFEDELNPCAINTLEWKTNSDTLTIASPLIHYIKIDDHIFEIQRSVQLWEVHKSIVHELHDAIQLLPSIPSGYVHPSYLAPATIIAVDSTVILSPHINKQ